MKTLRQLLENHRQAVSEDEIKEILESHCSKWDKKAYLYRGSGEYSSKNILDSTKQLRKSTNVGGAPYMFVMNGPAWRTVPKRARSIICSNSRGVASAYGVTHVIVPFDSVSKFAMSSSNDLWTHVPRQFDKPIIALSRRIYKQLSEAARRVVDSLDQDELSLLAVAELLIDRGLLSPNDEVMSEIKRFQKCTPADFGVKTLSRDTMQSFLLKNRVSPFRASQDAKLTEIWFSGQALSIPVDTYHRIVR